MATRHEKIVKTRNGTSGEEDSSVLWTSVDELIRLAGEGHPGELRHKLKEIVPEYFAEPEAAAEGGGPLVEGS